MVCYVEESSAPYFEDFNMVKRQSRPQTNEPFGLKKVKSAPLNLADKNYLARRRLVVKTIVVRGSGAAKA